MRGSSVGIRPSPKQNIFLFDPGNTAWDLEKTQSSFDHHRNKIYFGDGRIYILFYYANTAWDLEKHNRQSILFEIKYFRFWLNGRRIFLRI